MMQASHRAKGVQSALNPEGYKQPIVRMFHGGEWQFVMALHINDLVGIDREGVTVLYRVQQLESPNRLTLRLNTAATIGNKEEKIRRAISVLMSQGLVKYNINAIGIIAND